MLPDIWQNVRRVLAIQLGSLEDLVLTTPALETLSQALPNATITLMVTPAIAQMNLQRRLPRVEKVLTYESNNSLNADLNLIKQLTHSAFDAAVIFTNSGESPYSLAYICYLVGIPIRLGQSQEFGGGVLSHWVKLKEFNNPPVNKHLFLLESAGFPSAGGELCDHYAF